MTSPFTHPVASSLTLLWATGNSDRWTGANLPERVQRSAFRRLVTICRNQIQTGLFGARVPFPRSQFRQEPTRGVTDTFRFPGPLLIAVHDLNSKQGACECPPKVFPKTEIKFPRVI